jgi:4-hydroxy-tetrahydrodipicolinate reductase
MGQHKQYNVSLSEIHHIQKLDAPSGTAITLAEGILPYVDKNAWALEEDAKEIELTIRAERMADVPGTHTVDYNSETDKISIEHIAHNRDGFALGSVVAAEWLNGKSGIFTMKDVINIT